MNPVCLEGLSHGRSSEPYGHLLGFGGLDDPPAQGLLDFLSHGLERSEGVLVVTTPGRQRALARALEHLDADSAVREGRLMFMDAEESLRDLAPGDKPDRDRFDRLVGAPLRHLHSRFGDAGVRGYGDMVGLLWKRRRFSAAARLEEFWNKLREQLGFSLYCAYPIDVFSPEFDRAALDGIMRAHTHVVPACVDGRLERALNRAIDEVFGDRAAGLRSLMKPNFRPSWARVPRAEAIILWLRNNLRHDADAVLARARAYYRGESEPRP